MKKIVLKMRTLLSVVAVATFSSLLFACCYAPAPNEEFMEDVYDEYVDDQNQEEQAEEEENTTQESDTEENNEQA